MTRHVHVPGWLKEHGPTLIVALLLFLVTQAVIPQLQRGAAACTAVNKVVHYVDALVDKTTANAGAPPVRVADPAVQVLIDQGRKNNEEFRRFAREQSKKARCHP